MFERVRNFRDLGGLPAADGRRVRAGLLFRSGQLSQARPADCQRMRELGLRTIVDLRSTAERAERPSPDLGIADLRVVHGDYAHSRADLERIVRSASLQAADLRHYLAQGYRDMVSSQREAFSQMFQSLLEGGVPLLFHCAAGKDRTGAAAAVLLRSLGASTEVVEEDYLKTNADLGRTLRRLQRWSGPEGVSADTILPLAQADPTYLQTFFAAVDEVFGDLRGYLASLGVDAQAVVALQERLLEPAGG